MAGKAVFGLAQKSPALFMALSHLQAVVAAVAPKTLFSMLFASAAAGDHTLLRDTGFQQCMGRVLADCLQGNVRGYVRDVQTYVGPWQSTLNAVTVKTHLWHGTQDNGSPSQIFGY